MNAHIITIGDEILIGQTMNTNAAFIGSILAENQINIRSTSVVGDSEEDILKEFERCWKENDLIVTTGGLGPTHDDLTLPSVVKFFKTELVRDEEVLEDIKEFSEKRGRKITKINEGQAMVPKISKTIRNHIGTAPGVWIEKENKIFVVLPGVPFEMEEMMHSFVIPSLIEQRKELKSFTMRKTLKTTGLPESTLFERLGNLDELIGTAKLAFLPDQYGVKLRITVTEESEELAKNKILEIEQKIRNKAGRYIYSTKDESIEEVIARLINERGLKIAVAESCTGGNVSNFFTNVSGSSKYFERGIVSYSNAAKVELLRVNEDILAEHGAVSLEVARQMAEGVKSTSGADLGLSLTGIMGPTGATTGKPIGLVYIGLCDDKVCTAKKYQFGENRLLNKQRATQAALDLVRKYLLGISLDD